MDRLDEVNVPRRDALQRVDTATHLSLRLAQVRGSTAVTDAQKPEQQQDQSITKVLDRVLLVGS
jgi:hypothetical protein